jgi:hypothetical protein
MGCYLCLDEGCTAFCFLLLTSTLLFGISFFLFLFLSDMSSVPPPPDVGFLKTYEEAFPHGLNQETRPANLPDFSTMNVDQFVAWLKTQELGTFKIPLSNLNVHPEQRSRDSPWVVVIRGFMNDIGANMNSHPGSGMVNSEDVPKTSEGEPDPSQMRLTVLDGAHCGCVQMGKDDEQV